MTGNPKDTHGEFNKPPAKPSAKSRRWWFRGAGCFLVVVAIGVLLLMLVPVRRIPRETLRRLQCTRALREIGIALHEYAKEHQGLPPAHTVDATGMPLHSWRTLILPYIDDKALFKSIDFSKSWDDPANASAFNAPMPSVFRCPSLDSQPDMTTYLAVVASGSCLRPGEGRALDEITDGQSRTLLLIEVSGNRAVHWMSPQDASESMVRAMTDQKEWPHANGYNVVFCNGETTNLGANVTIDKLRAMISIAGNEDWTQFDNHDD